MMPFKHESPDTTYLIQQIWGCLADVTEFGRYSSLANSNDSNAKQLLTEIEREKFKKQLLSKFKKEIDIDIKKSLKRNISYIRRQIQGG